VQQKYPNLRMEDYPVVTRFIDLENEKSVIDLMKPLDDLCRAVFRNTVAVGKSHKIPGLEMALITKFAAMVSPRRVLDKKYLDAADFINIVKTNMESLNLKKLRRLAEKVYKGGAVEIGRLLENIKEGRPIQI
jgi:hypothetical protein